MASTQAPLARIRIGTAGWSIRRDQAGPFAADGSSLTRYASVFSCVEINSSFYRPHKPETYARWAESVPEDFRFAAKLPRTITHDARLRDAEGLLDAFLPGVLMLGQRLGVLLVQLPPSLRFDAAQAEHFFGHCAAAWPGVWACEPRHASWFTAEAKALLARFAVTRVGADPALSPAAATPLPQAGLGYWRLHGSPKIYYSAYGAEALDALAADLGEAPLTEAWCIFDNTAEGEALPNALALRDRLEPVRA